MFQGCADSVFSLNSASCIVIWGCYHSRGKSEKYFLYFTNKLDGFWFDSHAKNDFVPSLW